MSEQRSKPAQVGLLRACQSTILVAAVVGVLAAGAFAVPLNSAEQLFLENFEARPIAPISPTESCLRNSTHCTCDEKSYRPLIEAEKPGFCRLDPVERDGFVCGCPGTTLCEISEYPCSDSQYKRLRATGEFGTDGLVECEVSMSANDKCRKSVPVETCSKYSNIFIDGTLAGCVSNLQVISDIDDAYGLVNGRVSKLEGLELDMINLRVIETASSKNVHLCVIYGNWQEGEQQFPNDMDMSRKEKVRLTASSPLHIELRDDPTDQYLGDGTNQVLIFQEHRPSQSDGFCVGPFLNDGSGLRSEFFDLSNLLGVNVQTFDRATHRIENLAQWKFADHHALSELNADGRTNGDDSVTIDVQPTCACGASAPKPLEPAARPIDPIDATSQCINNATHCSCSEKPWRPLIYLEDPPNTCTLDGEREGYSCSCPGTSLCERVVTEPCTKLVRIGDFDEQGRVECRYIDNQTCSKAINPVPCSDFVSTYINGQNVGCSATAPVAANVDDMYGLSAASATVTDGALLDYINIRAIKSTSDGELHVCVVYGDAAQGQAQFGTTDDNLRKEKVKLTASYNINIELRDDPDDDYLGDGSMEVLMSHSHRAFKTDGFCVGPMLGDGSGFRALFYDLNNTLGVNMESYDGTRLVSQTTWTFKDNTASNDLAADGRANGDESVTVDILPSCACVA